MMPEHSAEANVVAHVYGELHRAAENWQRVGMDSLELAQLRNIRQLMAPESLDESNYIYCRLAV